MTAPQNPPPIGRDDWYVLSIDAIDSFDGMTPLHDFVALPSFAAQDFATHYGAMDALDLALTRVQWARQALAALSLAATDVSWEGDFRHEPYVGTLPLTQRDGWYLVVKQDNNGDSFIVSRGFAMPTIPGEYRHAEKLVPAADLMT